MKGREAIGYVVSIEGSRVTLNLKDTHKGQFASHRFGISSVTEINGLFGVDGGTRILVLRVISLSFIEPKEVHKEITPKGKTGSEPLRQVISSVVGWLSKIEDGFRFTSDSLATPSLGAEAFPLSSSELASIINPCEKLSGQIYLGVDSRGGSKVHVGLSDFLGRHVAILGATGQGKSCFTAAIIQQLLKLPKPRLIIFDINGEFEDAIKGHVSDSEFKITNIGGGDHPYKIPYYALGRHGISRLLLPSEKTQRPALNFAIENLNRVKWFTEKQGVGLISSSEPTLFDDCRQGDAKPAWDTIDSLRNGTAKAGTEWPPMSAIACLVAESHSIKKNNKGGFERDAFHYSNVVPLVTRIKRFVDDPMFTQVVNVDGGQPCNQSDLNWQHEGKRLVDDIFGGSEVPWKLHILNLRNVAHDLMPFVLGAFLELFAFELFKRGQQNSYPTLLILEEAHHYLRQFTGDEEGIRQSLAYERLAKEGRKFGLGLWISTQRPSEVSSTVLAQSGTWVVFRLTSDNDLKAVGSAGEWADRLEVNRISGLPRQQALVFGASIPIPIRIVSPEANPLPKSQDPDFSQWAR